MAKAHEQLKILLWTGYAKTTLVDDLSARWQRLDFSTALHGGFKDLHVTVPMPVPKAWEWLNRENLPGRHFYHLEVLEGKGVVWEGRVMNVGLVMDSQFQGVDMTAMGYWSSMRDQFYDPDDAGNTNWKAGGPHNVGKVIREMITKKCPDINGTANVTLTSRDITGIDLTARSYPMDNVVDKLALLSDSDGAIYYFAVWESRKPYFTKRSIAQVDWYTWLRDINPLRLAQEGMNLRNGVLPVVGTAEGTSTIAADSTLSWPLREMQVLLPAGVPNASANDARDTALAERKRPRQEEAFTIVGHVYSSRTAGQNETDAQAMTGAMVERPKWWVRAGNVIRVQDLVPASAATPKLDDLRTFYILETAYDATDDTLFVQPDRPPGRLDTLLARLNTLELRK